MAASSLVVRISADINDFSKQLDTMTRGVDRAAKKIESIGKAITLGITVPVAAAAVALAKMAAENEDTAARMERVFGSAASSVNASIQGMMKSVPEANTELQKMAISVDNMAQGLGLAPANAAKMSESLLKLAGDASAFAHVPMAQALDALSRGLAGKTKGLLEFGIAINEADIKAKAMSMGLLHQGNELTETGTALASYALIMEKSTRIQGEAARTADQAGKQFAFLKRDLGELADNVSALVLPALSDLAKKAREVIDWLSKLDSSTVKTFFNIAAAAAVLGLAIVIIVRVVDVVFKLRTALALLSTVGVEGFFATVAALPFGSIVLGVAAVTAAFVALSAAWDKYHAHGGALDSMSGIPPSARFGSPLNHDDALSKAMGVGALKIDHVAPSEDQLKKFYGYTGEQNGATERAPAVDAMKALEDRASAVTTSLKQMANGWTVPGMTVEWFHTLSAVETKLASIKNAFDPVAVKLRGIVDDMKEAAATTFGARNLPNISGIPGVQAPIQSGVTINPQVAQLPGMTAANEAALRYAETQQYVTENTAYEYQRLRSNLDEFGIHLGNVGERMQSVILTLANAATNFAQMLLSNVGGSGKGAGTGRGLGGLLGGLAGTVLGGPIGGAVGSFLGTAAGGLVGGLFDHHKQTVDRASTSMENLSKTVDKVSASISNMPQWFKIAGYRFAATAPVVPPTPAPPSPIAPTPSTPSGDPTDGGKSPEKGGANASRSPVFNIQSLSIQSSASNVKQLLAEIEKAAFEKQSTGSASGFAFAFQGA